MKEEENLLYKVVIMCKTELISLSPANGRRFSLLIAESETKIEPDLRLHPVGKWQ